MNLPSIMLMCAYVHKTCCFGLDIKVVVRDEDIKTNFMPLKPQCLHRTYICHMYVPVHQFL